MNNMEGEMDNRTWGIAASFLDILKCWISENLLVTVA